MQYDYQALGIVIRRIRKSHGLTQEVLSGFATIPRSHLSMIECATMQPTLDTLSKIVDALDMPLSELIRLAEEESQNSKQNQ